MFMGLLVQNGTSYSSLANRISRIKSVLVFNSISTASGKALHEIIQINKPLTITRKAIIDVPMLRDMITVCDSMYMGQIFKAIYLIPFLVY